MGVRFQLSGKQKGAGAVVTEKAGQGRVEAQSTCGRGTREEEPWSTLQIPGEILAQKSYPDGRHEMPSP